MFVEKSNTCNNPYLISKSRKLYSLTLEGRFWGSRSSRVPNILARLAKTGSVAKASVSDDSSTEW